jgi:hypothetical protein
MGNQGRALSDEQVRRILSLLASTELSVPEISERMGCSRSTVISLNRFHGVRDYQGHRSKWISAAPMPGSVLATMQAEGRDSDESRR